MCAGISLSIVDLPENLFEEFHLADRIKANNATGELEIRFLFRDPKAQLPVRLSSEIEIDAWGNRDDKTSRLPKTGWCRLESFTAGKWKFLHPEEVIIPARRGIEKGVWFDIENGIRGVRVLDSSDQPHVYMLTENASDEYLRLTGHPRMPVFV